jgi:hypothetical protein
MDRRNILSLPAITALGLALLPVSALKSRAQEAPPRPPAWPNKRLLDLLKIEPPHRSGALGLDLLRGQ